MASNNNFDFPHFPPTPPPPPPPATKPPPPPHVRPPPPPSPPRPLPPPPPAPSPSNNTTVIVVVFVSFGGILFLACAALALCCFIKKRKKQTTQETDIVHIDEHLKVREAIVEGPDGPRAVLLDIEDDVHVDEIIENKKKVEEDKLHGKKSSGYGGVSAIALQAGEGATFPSSSSSGSKSSHPQIEHKA